MSTRFPTLLSLSLRLRSYCKSASHLSGPRVSLCCCSSSGVGAVQEHQGWLPPLGSDRSVPMFSMQVL